MTSKTMARAEKTADVIRNRWGGHLADRVYKGILAGRLMGEILSEYQYQSNGQHTGLRLADLS